VHIASRAPSWCDELWLADSTSLPCAASRQTVQRSDLAGAAGYGYCASHSGFFWGFRLYLVCAGDGMPIMWALANPKIGERAVLATMLDRDAHLIRAGQLILADKGFAGREFDAHVTGLGARTAATRHPATATSAASGNGSNRSTTPSKANSAWKNTAAEP